MAVQNIDDLVGMTLFADLSRPDVSAVAHIFEEEYFPSGQRILRQGFSGYSFYVIVEGEASVNLNGQELATLSRGDCFGEISILLEEPPTADVIAVTPLRCITLPATGLREFLLSYPAVMYRMLQGEAYRLKNANKWRS